MTEGKRESWRTIGRVFLYGARGVKQDVIAIRLNLDQSTVSKILNLAYFRRAIVHTKAGHKDKDLM